ncbi:MAG TPA: hypothetical protein VM266_11440 [Solirubrobacteraceae bacterium]|nr:hypothetical protein [Solirubrobacteraceae bacterium]
MRFAECMREHGIDMADPKIDGGRVLMSPGTTDPSDPANQKASAACRRHLPKIGSR